MGIQVAGLSGFSGLGSAPFWYQEADGKRTVLWRVSRQQLPSKGDSFKSTWPLCSPCLPVLKLLSLVPPSYTVEEKSPQVAGFSPLL